MVGNVCRVKPFHLDGKRFADGEEVETEVRKWLRQQSKDFLCCWFRRTGKVTEQVYQCWWKICREIHFPPQVRILHVLRLTYVTFFFFNSGL
jgi:hypothetical protein